MYNRTRESKIVKTKGREKMGKREWKIFHVSKDQFIAVIPPDNAKWKIEWHKTFEGLYGPQYYDDRYKSEFYLQAFRSFSSGKEAADYIKGIEERSDCFVMDVTKEYL